MRPCTKASLLSYCNTALIVTDCGLLLEGSTHRVRKDCALHWILPVAQVADLKAELGTELLAQLSASERTELGTLAPQLKSLQVST